LELTGFAPMFLALGGLLFSIPINYAWNVYKQPVLRIKRQVELRKFDVELTKDHLNWIYEAKRIIVENVGRSAAKNCKGWIVTDVGKERVCWTVPKERPNATINVKDSERLDFCAYYVEGLSEYSPASGLPPKEVPKRISPTEDGWKEQFKNRDITNLTECKILITSDNAKPVEARVVFRA
jgi:hypothetical protein